MAFRLPSQLQHPSYRYTILCTILRVSRRPRRTRMVTDERTVKRSQLYALVWEKAVQRVAAIDAGQGWQLLFAVSSSAAVGLWRTVRLGVGSVRDE